MTDDKEERIQLSLTIAEYQELIEGYIGNSEGVYEKLKNAEPTSKPQQHTDEEYDHIKECYDHVYDDWKVSRNAFEARIKELEAELSRANCKYCNKPLTRHNPHCCVKHEVEARK